MPAPIHAKVVIIGSGPADWGSEDALKLIAAAEKPVAAGF